MNSSLPYLCPPSAKAILLGCGIDESKITVIAPGQNYQFSKGKVAVEVIATKGALLGPPWQMKENGYVIRPAASSSKKFSSIYYEPQ
jgi:hypothetical protein